MSAKIHKVEKSPYKSVNDLCHKWEVYGSDVYKVLINQLSKVLGLEIEKAGEESLIFKGRIQYNPETGKPIKRKDWKALEQAIIKYLHVEKDYVQKKMVEDSFWLGTMINRLNKETRKLQSLERIKSIYSEEELNYTPRDYELWEIEEQEIGIYIQNVNDKVKSKIQTILINGIKQRKPRYKIWQDLWDMKDEVNRDWERVVRTEVANNSNNGILIDQLNTSGEENIFMIGISAPDACPYCKRLVNKKVVVLKDGPVNGNDTIKINGKKYSVIWPEKTNYGRKPNDYWSATTIHPYCLLPDTELLTNEGWKFFYELSGKEKVFGINPKNFEVDWVGYNKIVEYDFDGELIYLKSKCLDLGITEDHNNLIIDTNLKWREVKSKDLKISDRLPKAIGKWEGNNPEFININGIKFTTLQFVRFMSWYLSEGNLNRDNYISIAQKNIDIVYKDLKDLPLTIIKSKKNKLCEKLYIKSKELNNYLKQFGHSKDKFIPEEIKGLSKEYLREFLRIYCLGDGTERNKNCNIRGYKFNSRRRIFYTTSKKMSADLSELLIKIGKFPSFSIVKKGNKSLIRDVVCETKNDVISIHETNSKTVGFRKTKKYYSGKVYDIEMEKWHFFLVRRNGKAVWSGNCRCTWSEWFPELEKYV